MREAIWWAFENIKKYRSKGKKGDCYVPQLTMNRHECKTLPIKKHPYNNIVFHLTQLVGVHSQFSIVWLLSSFAQAGKNGLWLLGVCQCVWRRDVVSSAAGKSAARCARNSRQARESMETRGRGQRATAARGGVERLRQKVREPSITRPSVSLWEWMAAQYSGWSRASVWHNAPRIMAACCDSAYNCRRAGFRPQFTDSNFIITDSAHGSNRHSRVYGDMKQS